MSYRSRIMGIGAYLPPRVVTNAELSTMMETTNEWIVERTGIEDVSNRCGVHWFCIPLL